jgi:hypothetical protein
LKIIFKGGKYRGNGQTKKNELEIKGRNAIFGKECMPVMGQSPNGKSQMNQLSSFRGLNNQLL